MPIRQPIIALIGHIDHGKTTILDFIRGTSIAKTEPGLITQKISSYNISIKKIKKLAEPVLKNLKTKITIPGLLFIDTPGHASFISLRKRGGNLADIAILVIDINEGIKEQTIESINILKEYKTPFIIALNKIDLIQGFTPKNNSLLETLKNQPETTKRLLNNKLYSIVAKLYEFNFNSERFDKIKDYTKQIPLIPISAKTGLGIPELLTVLLGLTQKYLEKTLKIQIKGQAEGIILEISEQKGLGKCLETIIYNGTLKQKDTIIIGSINEPIVTKVRALFIDKKNIKQVTAAASVTISAPNIEQAIPGMPIRSAKNNIDQIKSEIQREIQEILIKADKQGVIIKADTLGSLEALTKLLKEQNIKIKKASIGEITKKDILEAETEKNPLNQVILGFNIKPTQNKIKIITNNIIYKLLEDFNNWLEKQKKKLERKKLERLTLPCKIKILKGYIFRQSNPAIVGVEVLAGKLKPNTPLMKQGKYTCTVKSIQSKNQNISEAKKGQEVAVSFPNITIGRQLKEQDILLSDISEQDFINLKRNKQYLTNEEKDLLKEIAEIKRKHNPLWGI